VNFSWQPPEKPPDLRTMKIKAKKIMFFLKIKAKKIMFFLKKSEVGKRRKTFLTTAIQIKETHFWPLLDTNRLWDIL